MQKGRVIKWQEIPQVMNHSRLKRTIMEAYITDKTILSVLATDLAEGISNVVITNIDSDYPDRIATSVCVHTDWSEVSVLGYVISTTEPVTCSFVMHVPDRCDLYTGECSICNKKHIVARPMKIGQKSLI